MPLTPEDKDDFYRDARDPLRRDAFHAVRRSSPPLTFEEYLHWLNDLQRLFPFGPPSRRPIPTQLNRL